MVISAMPKGPSRTKNTTDSKLTIRSKFATAIVKHYGGHFETIIFEREITQQIATEILKNYGGSKHYGIECRSVFSTEGSFGCRENGQNPMPQTITWRCRLIHVRKSTPFGCPSMKAFCGHPREPRENCRKVSKNFLMLFDDF